MYQRVVMFESREGKESEGVINNKCEGDKRIGKKTKTKINKVREVVKIIDKTKERKKD